MRAKSVFRLLLGLFVIVGMSFVNMLFFERWLGFSYVKWYLANGAMIGLLSALLALAWGDLNRHVGLIAAHPLEYLLSYIRLAGLPLSEFGAYCAGEPPVKNAAGHFDRMLASGLAALLCAAVALWIVVIVPIQYFMYLVCGAPGRVYADTQRRLAAHVTEHRLQTRVIAAGERLPEGWWEANLASRPVTATGIFAALLLTAATLARTA
jgi:hypothetical protein